MVGKRQNILFLLLSAIFSLKSGYAYVSNSLPLKDRSIERALKDVLKISERETVSKKTYYTVREGLVSY